MEEHASTGFLPLLLVLFLAFLVPLLLSRFKRIPVVVGEIVAGIIIGHSGFNLVGENPTLVVMSDIGLAFLMFLAGNQQLSRVFKTQSPIDSSQNFLYTIHKGWRAFMRDYEFNQQLRGNSPHMVHRSLFVESCQQETNQSDSEIKLSFFNWLFPKYFLEKSQSCNPSKAKTTE